MRRYIDVLHRYLHLRDARPQQQQQQQLRPKHTVVRKKLPLSITTQRPPSPPVPAPLSPASCAVRRLSQMMMMKFSSQSQQRRQNRRQYRRQGGRKKRDSTATTGRSISENKLHVNYTTPSLPGSFTAVRNLKRYTDGESVNSVKRYLLAQDA